MKLVQWQVLRMSGLIPQCAVEDWPIPDVRPLQFLVAKSPFDVIL